MSIFTPSTDLQQVVDENLNQRSEAAKAALVEVDQAVVAFMRWLYGMRAARSLKKIRELSHGHERDLTERALRKIQAGNEPREVLEQMASTPDQQDPARAQHPAAGSCRTTRIRYPQGGRPDLQARGEA